MENKLIVFFSLVTSLTVALPTNIYRTNDVDDSTLEKPQVDDARTKRQAYNIPSSEFFNFVTQDNLYQQFENVPINNYAENLRGLALQYVPLHTNYFIDHASQQLRNDPNSFVAPIEYIPQIPSFSADKSYETPIARSDNFDLNGMPSQYFYETTSRNSNADEILSENTQHIDSTSNRRTLADLVQNVPFDLSHTIPGHIWTNIKEEVTPFINAYTRTAQEQINPVQAAPVYYSFQFVSDPARPVSGFNIRQIIPSPQEVFNSALNIGNRIIERIPGYHLGANVVGFVGNITRVGATLLNNQIQGQFSPGPSRPLAFPNQQPNGEHVPGLPMQVVPYPTSPAKITNAQVLNNESGSSSGNVSDKYKSSSEEKEEEDSTEHNDAEESDKNSQEADSTSQEAPPSSQETGVLDASPESNEESLQNAEDGTNRYSQENTKPSEEFNNPVVKDAGDYVEDADNRDNKIDSKPNPVLKDAGDDIKDADSPDNNTDSKSHKPL